MVWTFLVIFVGTFLGDVHDIGHRFEYGSDTEVNMGCGASIYDEFWYFGGESSKRRQVRMKVDPGKLFVFIVE